MITPLLIQERVAKINSSGAPLKHIQSEILALYRDVLLDVACGSIDPRTLAIEAIKAEGLSTPEGRRIL